MSTDELLKDLFGDSDSEPDVIESCDGNLPTLINEPTVYSGLHQYDDIPGLTLVKGWLNGTQQAAFRAAIEAEGWFDCPGSNQVMRFGYNHLPGWAKHLASLIPKSLFPVQISQRQPMFDQLIVNLYRPGDGIKSHIDLLRFEDGICSVSFGDPVVMDFQHDEDPGRSLQVLLEGGDLLVMYGTARYQWHHGIQGVTEDTYQGRTFKRGTRLSVTFRRLCDDIVLTHQ